MYRITLECAEIDPGIGAEAAADIEQEFREYRNWWSDPVCRYADGKLRFQASFDVGGAKMALLDEFSDCLVAYVGEHGQVQVVSVAEE